MKGDCNVNVTRTALLETNVMMRIYEAKEILQEFEKVVLIEANI